MIRPQPANRRRSPGVAPRRAAPGEPFLYSISRRASQECQGRKNILRRQDAAGSERAELRPSLPPGETATRP
jgi:hypothetical protein